MMAFAAADLLVHSDVFDVALAGVAIALLCVAQILDLGTRRRLFMRVAIPATTLCLVVVVLSLYRFSALGG